MKRKLLASGDVFTYKRKLFKFEVLHDEDMREPWKEHDGHGIISEWTTRDKRPSERVLVSDRNSKRYYDIGETIKVALRDGWGPGDEERAKLPENPTKRQIAAAAVESDFRYMRAWCNDEWQWVYVLVTRLQKSKHAPNGYFTTVDRESVGGIESTSGDEYLSDTGYELADECISGRRMYAL